MNFKQQELIRNHMARITCDLKAVDHCLLEADGLVGDLLNEAEKLNQLLNGGIRDSRREIEK